MFLLPSGRTVRGKVKESWARWAIPTQEEWKEKEGRIRVCSQFCGSWICVLESLEKEATPDRNQACSQDDQLGNLWDTVPAQPPVCRQLPLSSRSEQIPVVLLSSPQHLKPNPTEYRGEMRTKHILLALKFFDILCLLFSASLGSVSMPWNNRLPLH